MSIEDEFATILNEVLEKGPQESSFHKKKTGKQEQGQGFIIKYSYKDSKGKQRTGEYEIIGKNEINSTNIKTFTADAETTIKLMLDPGYSKFRITSAKPKKMSEEELLNFDDPLD